MHAEIKYRWSCYEVVSTADITISVDDGCSYLLLILSTADISVDEVAIYY